jgi:tetratricopeptide (TPR) repeat protein
MKRELISRAKAKLWLPITVLVCVTAIIYLNSLSNGFVYDDMGTIVEKVHIKNLSKNFSSFFKRYYFKISGGEASYRPIATLSYYLLYSIFKLNPWGYHLISLVLHILNVVLVYLLVNLMLGNKRSSLIAGLLFASHPVHTEVVDCISYNEDLLAAFFFFLALWLYGKLDPAAIKRNLIFYILSLLFFLLGLLSKEMAITLPAIVIVYDLTLREPETRATSFKLALNTAIQRRYLYCGYMAVALFYLWLRFFALNNPEESVTRIWGSLFDRIIYLPVVFVDYIKLVLFPLNLNADYVFSYPTRFFEADPMISFLIVLGLIIFSFFIFKHSKATSLGIWWFFITLFPVYNLIEIYNPFAERYLYIPLFGFCLVVSILAESLLNRVSFPRAGVFKFAVVLCVVVFYAMISIPRNRDWRDSYSLWTKTLEIAPNSVRAHGNLARVYQERGQIEDSMREVKKTIELNPKGFKAYYNLGVILAEQGLLEEAIGAYQKTIKINPKYSNAHFNLGNIYKQQNLLEQAAEEYKKVIEIDPQDIEARNNLGVVFAIQGRLDDALSEWQKIIEFDPDNKEVHDNIIKAKKMINK